MSQGGGEGRGALPTCPFKVRKVCRQALVSLETWAPTQPTPSEGLVGSLLLPWQLQPSRHCPGEQSQPWVLTEGQAAVRVLWQNGLDPRVVPAGQEGGLQEKSLVPLSWVLLEVSSPWPW